MADGRNTRKKAFQQNHNFRTMPKSLELLQVRGSIPEELELSELDFLDETPSRMSEQVYQMRCGIRLQKIPVRSLEESLKCEPNKSSPAAV